MTPSKLTDSDKRQIVELYRRPGETTMTLASQYGVSNTTISRILKSSLPAAEYDGLIQQKRLAARTAEISSRPTAEKPVQGSILETLASASEEADGDVEVLPSEPVELAASVPLVLPSGKTTPAPIRRSRKRSSAEFSEPEEDVRDPVQLITHPKERLPVIQESEAIAAAAILDEGLSTVREAIDEEDDLDDLEDDLEEGLDDDEDDLDDDEAAALMPALQLGSTDFIRVLPLTEAAIPRTCYLVVDRSAELVARPLREFGELGQIPSEEIQEKTLPVFDNHRVAKRFSNIRTQRVIKIPDSRILQKAAPHLQAKGITRLLIDGQVYAL
ncbi:MAG: transposase [Leptolyngbyaceae cyanobacterium CSU_1_3]|nr:transposase [Leptolyngbyaceae cyanobacterium CSU_1_3]